MDFLFIHGNYPAQFRHLAALLEQNPEHRVVFLTARQDAATEALPGVKCIPTPATAPPTARPTTTFRPAKKRSCRACRTTRDKQPIRSRPKATRCGESWRYGYRTVSKRPTTTNPTCSLFRVEFQAETTRHLLAEFDLDAQLKTSLRNLPILQELERCDLAWYPLLGRKPNSRGLSVET